MNTKPVSAIIVGAGHRALIYADLALSHPELLKIVGVADPNPVRRENEEKRYCKPRKSGLCQTGNNE